MRLEYTGLADLNGSLVALEGVSGVSYDELAELTLADGSHRYGRVILLEGILMVLAATWFGCALIYMCMTIGAVVAKKHKVLAAFGVYYGVNMGFSFVMQIAMVLGLAFVVLPLGALLAEATYGMACTLVALLLLMIFFTLTAISHGQPHANSTNTVCSRILSLSAESSANSLPVAAVL